MSSLKKEDANDSCPPRRLSTAVIIDVLLQQTRGLHALFYTISVFSVGRPRGMQRRNRVGGFKLSLGRTAVLDSKVIDIQAVDRNTCSVRFNTSPQTVRARFSPQNVVLGFRAQ